VLIHRDADLSDAEKQQLIAALDAMNAGGGDNRGRGSGED
jgi:hypothetical protein